MIDIAVRFVNSIFALYMLLILVRWLGRWLELDMRYGWFRWIPAVTDPLVNSVRKMLPSMGPLDFGPPATLFLVWIARTIAVTFLLWVWMANLSQGAAVK